MHQGCRGRWQDSYVEAHGGKQGRATRWVAPTEKTLFTVARDRFCQTTRNDSGQRVVNREKRAEKGSFVQILGSFKPFRAGGGGIWEAWGAGRGGIVPPEMGVNGRVLGSYWHFSAKWVGKVSAVEHRPADLVSQLLILQDECVNRLGELFALPTALEPAGAFPWPAGAAARAALIA